MLPAPFDDALATLLGRKARDSDCVVLAVGSASDHVHVLLRLSPSAALADVVQRLKGATAHEINHRRLLHDRLVWQAGYWAESFRPVDTQPLREYLRVQRLHHDDSNIGERWQLAEWEPAPGGL